MLAAVDSGKPPYGEAPDASSNIRAGYARTGVVNAATREAVLAAHYQDKLAREDVGQYYRLLFLPAAQREPAMALYAFWLEVREINDECADPEIARVKLAWWHEEVQRMYACQPRHPLACALAPVAAHYALAAHEFDALLAALVQHVGTAAYPTYQALREHGRRTRGRIESLAAAIAGHADSMSAARAADLGATLEILAIIQNIGTDTQRGRVYLPQEDLARFGVTTEDVRAGCDNAAMRALIGRSLERVQRELAHNAAALAGDDSAWASSSRLAITTAQALVAKIAAAPQALWREPPALSPLRLLWNAWRAARRVRRRARS